MRGRYIVMLTPLVLLSLCMAADTQEQAATVRWPERWMLFGPVPWEHTTPDAAQLREAPERLRLGEQEHIGQQVTFDGNRLDLSALLGGHQRQDTVYLFAEIEAARAMTVPIGAAADWWMAWWVNGEPVYDTLESGNAGQDFSVGAHTFEANLREGTNVIAIRVSAGREGFLLVAGIPPAERWEALLQSTRDRRRHARLRELVSAALERDEAGQSADARELLLDALGLTQPDKPIALSLRLRLGESHERDDQPNEARVIYGDLLNSPLPAWARPVVQMRLAQTLQAAGDRAAALEAWTELTQMSNVHPKARVKAQAGAAECETHN